MPLRCRADDDKRDECARRRDSISRNCGRSRPNVSELDERAGVEDHPGELDERAGVEALGRELVERAGVEVNMDELGIAPAP
ncbi:MULTISPECIES: hypothetical protein [Sorangium]|uniref:hypothetical protein n=1 Tax=Sorangium TaxID=39643 RepID=UPI00101A46F8|nr:MULTISPECIES: hypothetical protein [Sorangium]